MWQYSKLVKCPLENRHFASYMGKRAVFIWHVCKYQIKNIFIDLCDLTGLTRFLRKIIGRIVTEREIQINYLDG